MLQEVVMRLDSKGFFLLLRIEKLITNELLYRLSYTGTRGKIIQAGWGSLACSLSG
jgi:hypothetical protein